MEFHCDNWSAIKRKFNTLPRGPLRKKIPIDNTGSGAWEGIEVPFYKGQGEFLDLKFQSKSTRRRPFYDSPTPPSCLPM